MQDLGPPETETSNKRHKSDASIGLGPAEEVSSSMSIPAPGLLYRQLTLDSEEQNDGSGAAKVDSPSVFTKHACFGAGCYWGTEHFLKHDFGHKYFLGSGKVLSGDVGFMGPYTAKQNPKYVEVRSGTTDHVEVYDFHFEGNEQTYEDLVKHFFMFHDPTTVNHQGHDEGTQYASTIWCYDDKQTEIANRVKNELQELIDNGQVTKFTNKTVVTAIRDATVFYAAHLEHQEYLTKNPDGECNHFYRFKVWPEVKKQE